MSEPRTGSNRKLALFLLGGLLLLTVVFSLLEKVVPRNTGAATIAAPGEESAPIRPELSREGEATVVINAGFLHNSRIRYGGDNGPERADALFACLEAGIETEFGPEDAPIDPLDGTDRRSQRAQMRSLMKEIQDRCTTGESAANAR